MNTTATTEESLISASTKARFPDENHAPVKSFREEIGITGFDYVPDAAEVLLTIRELGERGFVLRSPREGIDTMTAAGRMVAGVLASLAGLGLELGRERRSAAHAARRARASTWPPEGPRLFHGRVGEADACRWGAGADHRRDVGVSAATAYRVVALP